MDKHWLRNCIVLTCLLLASLHLPAQAFAQTSGVPNVPGVTATPTNGTQQVTPENCTSATTRAKAFSGTDDGILSEIYRFMQDVVGTATKKLFSAFTSNPAYQQAVYWSMVLMVIFFGVGFTIGVVQASFGQVLGRLIKFGIIAALISPQGWAFFSGQGPNDLGMVKFFMDGTDELVKGVIEIGTQVQAPAGATPFYQLDRLANFLIHPDTLINIMGATVSGPYGLAMSGLLVIAMLGFAMLLIKALRLYAVTFVGRSLLLGIAPIFFVFLLFDRTKQMFMSWLNAMLSMSLQPILLFTFLSFFVVMIESASKEMMSAELCWTEFQNVRGSEGKTAFWRYLDKTTNQIDASKFTWEGSLQCLIEGEKDGRKCPEFPINIVDVLSFLILVYIAQRFADVIERIANELSNTFISLDAGGKIDQFISQQGNNLMQAITPGAGQNRPNRPSGR